MRVQRQPNAVQQGYRSEKICQQSHPLSQIRAGTICQMYRIAWSWAMKYSWLLKLEAEGEKVASLAVEEPLPLDSVSRSPVRRACHATRQA